MLQGWTLDFGNDSNQALSNRASILFFYLDLIIINSLEKKKRMPQLISILINWKDTIKQSL